MPTELARNDGGPNGNPIQKFFNAHKTSLIQIAGGKDEYVKSAALLIAESDSLQKCLSTSAGTLSLYNALKRGATIGLSLNPQLQEATIIAYDDRATYQIMKNGLVKLALVSGHVKSITSDLVRDADKFAIGKSVDGDVYRHEIETRNRGPVIGFYAACRMSGGETHVKYMTMEEAQEHRDAYARSRKPGAAWEKSFTGMAIKTVIKALLRNLYINDDVTRAVVADDAEECDVLPEHEAAPELPAKPSQGYDASDIKGALEAADMEKLAAASRAEAAEAARKSDKQKPKQADEDRKLF